MNEQLRELGMVAYTCDPKCLGIETAWASWAQEDLVSTRKQFFCQIIITQGLWAGAVSPFQLASLLIHTFPSTSLADLDSESHILHIKSWVYT